MVISSRESSLRGPLTAEKHGIIKSTMGRGLNSPPAWCVFTKLTLCICCCIFKLQQTHSHWTTKYDLRRLNIPLHIPLSQPVLDQVLYQQTGIVFTVKFVVFISAPTTTTFLSPWMRRVFSLFILKSLNINAHKCWSGWSHRCLPPSVSGNYYQHHDYSCGLLNSATTLVAVLHSWHLKGQFTLLGKCNINLTIHPFSIAPCSWAWGHERWLESLSVSKSESRVTFWTSYQLSAT